MSARHVNKARRILYADKGLFAGMNTLLEGRLYGSALVLCYSLIDIMAWLSLPADREETTKSDFVSWVEHYLLPDSGLDCEAINFYGARCGMLHTMTPESSLSRAGKAIPITYSTGSYKPYPRDFLARLSKPYIMLHVETLCGAVDRAARKFFDEVQADKTRLHTINKRALTLFRDNTKLPPYVG